MTSDPRGRVGAPEGRPRRDSGLALLVVLLAITLLTIVVVEFTDATQVETHLALSARNALQATYLARSGVNVGEALVIADAQIGRGGDHLHDVWAGPFPPLPIGDGTVAFRIRDESRFLNLNDMVSGGSLRGERVDVFRRLFEMLGVDATVLPAIVDWLDSDSVPTVRLPTVDPAATGNPPGAEQSYYLGLRRPEIVRNGPLLTLRELLLIRGVTPTVLARLEEFVTVLPVQNALRVNVNTADPLVLQALSPDLTPALVKALVEARGTVPLTSMGEIRDISGLDEALGQHGRSFIDFGSAYFRIEAVGEINDVGRGIVEIVKRDRTRLSRITWTPSSTTLALTSQPPSDFLATLPLLGDS